MLPEDHAQGVGQLPFPGHGVNHGELHVGELLGRGGDGGLVGEAHPDHQVKPLLGEGADALAHLGGVGGLKVKDLDAELLGRPLRPFPGGLVEGTVKLAAGVKGEPHPDVGPGKARFLGRSRLRGGLFLRFPGAGREGHGERA